jgi:photosystem II stability/assembly factor-like uncharacterized protein
MKRALLVFLLTAPLSLAAAQTSDFNTLRFREIGPANMSGRVVDMAVVESNPYVWYVASATGGVWKTINNGVTWQPVFHREATHSVGALAVHQRDTNIVWVGTGERANRQSSGWGDGVYKSTDGGRSWRNMGLRESHHIGRIVMHPGDPNTVFVAAMGHLWGPNEERGLYRTTDGGNTWRRVLGVNEHTGVVDVALDPSNPRVMYAATYERRRAPYGFDGGGPGSALYKSTDGGDTWRKLAPSGAFPRDSVRPGVRPPTLHDANGLPLGEYGRIGITVYPKDPRIVYVSIEQGWRYNASTAYVGRRAGIYRSQNAGETWERMSDWNPRPMYASQPQVDPNDPCRIYMQNEFSVSTDCGKTFTAPRQSLHGDDRFVWIDPRDSRHLIKLDDGGIGVSYDFGRTWLFVQSLPISQWYRIAADNARPFNLYGGLQDNGSWYGPSATYRSEGILNEDWTRIGGGDGFFALPDTTNPRVIYSASQYLGLQKLDPRTLQRQDVRPDNARGAIGARRNFDSWFLVQPEAELANAMAGANWDAPYIISPHDGATLYAGTSKLWKSTNRGLTWTSLGDMTTGVNRRELPINGRRADELTPSQDDGNPYYPTLTAIAESPRQRGLLYVGTDDGNVKVSRDGGATWHDAHTLMGRLASNALPRNAWINGIEASRHAVGTAYVVANNYRNDDFGSYIYKTTDAGRSWTSITSDLPAGRVARTLREDPRNPNVLYLGTELGLFVSTNGGTNWTELRANLPTLAINDLLVHPRDNDLVIATHGRGIWILDDVNPLQELTPAVKESAAHLFRIEPAYQVRLAAEKAHVGDMIFRGENPPTGAIVQFWLKDASTKPTFTVLDASGRTVATLSPNVRAGVNRFVWGLRHDSLPAGVRGGGDEDEGGGGAARALPGQLVLPGTYTLRMSVGGVQRTQTVRVMDDPRINVTPVVRAQWSADLTRIADVYRTAVELNRGKNSAETRELLRRVSGLYSAVSGWTGPMTSDQTAQLQYFRRKIAELR